MAVTKFNKPSRVSTKKNTAAVKKNLHPRKFDVDLKQILQDQVHREEALRILYALTEEPSNEESTPIRQLPVALLPAFFKDESTFGRRHFVCADLATYTPDEEIKTVSIHSLGYGSCVIDRNNRKSSIEWIRSMLSKEFLEDVLHAGLERAAEQGITIRSSIIQPALPDWQAVEAPNEATLGVDVEGVNEEGEYMASTPTTEAMAPEFPMGEPIIFRADVEPQNGAVVLAFVTQLSSSYRVSAREGQSILVIRRFAIDPATGRAVLSPMAKGFESFIEEPDGASRCKIEVLGVATSHKVAWTRYKSPEGYEAVCIEGREPRNKR